jgi:hypothetical protein
VEEVPDEFGGKTEPSSSPTTRVSKMNAKLEAMKEQGNEKEGNAQNMI